MSSTRTDLPHTAWLGVVEYHDAHARQRQRREDVIAGRADEVLWLLEHPPTITLGRRGGEVIAAPPNVPVVPTERGGLATWHGPGQLVGYPIFNLGRRRWAVKEVVAGIEDGLIAWLARVGVQAGRRAGSPGVWVGHAKIAALGLHVRHGVTMHGFALNLRPDLAGYAAIVACGIADGGVTSVAALLGASPSPEVVANEVGQTVIAAISARHG